MALNEDSIYFEVLQMESIDCYAVPTITSVVQGIGVQQVAGTDDSVAILSQANACVGLAMQTPSAAGKEINVLKKGRIKVHYKASAHPFAPGTFTTYTEGALLYVDYDDGKLYAASTGAGSSHTKQIGTIRSYVASEYFIADIDATVTGASS